MLGESIISYTHAKQSGSLAVAGARDLAPLINSLSALPFSVVVATQDWHPEDHVSFASNHPNKKPLTDYVTLKNPNPDAGGPAEKPQRLWPVHCVQSSPGAELIKELDFTSIDLIVKKGMDSSMEM